MASAKRDFERFVSWLYLPAIPAAPDVKRLANLALANLDGLAQTVPRHSQGWRVCRHQDSCTRRSKCRPLRNPVQVHCARRTYVTHAVRDVTIP